MKVSVFASIGAAAALALVSPAYAQATSTALAPAPTDAVSASKLGVAREVVDLGYPADQRQAMFFGSMDQMMKQMREAALRAMPAADAGALAILDKWLATYSAQAKTTLASHIPELMRGVTLAYANMFTEAELIDLRNFLATPSGKGFLQRSSAILSDPSFAKANQDYMNAIMAQLPAAQAELRSQLEAYYRSKGASAPKGQ